MANIFDEFVKQMNDDLMNAMSENIQTRYTNNFTPNRILKSGNATVVFWKDGSKTVVKLPKGETPDDYEAFTAALAIKIFGSNSKLKKVIKNMTVVQEIKKKGDK